MEADPMFSGGMDYRPRDPAFNVIAGRGWYLTPVSMLNRLRLQKRLLLFHIPGIREAELFLPHPQNIYAHALPNAQKEAAAKMASLLR